jgi:hypothetical protein
MRLSTAVVALLLVSACGDEVVLCDPADPACAGPQGEKGSPGDPGAPGDPGPAGPAGASCPAADLIAPGGNGILVARFLDENGIQINGDAMVVGFVNQVRLTGVEFFTVAADGSCDPDLPVFNRAIANKGTDRSTTTLLTKAAQGATLQSIKISELVPASAQLAYQWTLSNVKLLNVQQSTDLPAQENWTLGFEQFQLVTYNPSNGQPLQPAFCWNLVTNTAC